MRLRYFLLLIVLLLLLMSLPVAVSADILSVAQQLDQSSYYSGYSGSVSVWVQNTGGEKMQVRKLSVHFDWMSDDQTYSKTFKTPITLESGDKVFLGSVEFKIPRSVYGLHSYYIYIETWDFVRGTKIWKFGPYSISIAKATPKLSFLASIQESTAVQGKALPVHVIITNDGTGPSTETKIILYVDGVRKFYKFVGTVEPGTKDLTLNWVVPANVFAGTHEIQLKVFCKEMEEPLVSNTMKIKVVPPHGDYFMKHLGKLAGTIKIYRRKVNGRTVSVVVYYNTIIAAEKTKYCGLSNIPPPFSIADQVNQWKNGYSINRMYNSIDGCWYYVYFPAKYEG